MKVIHLPPQENPKHPTARYKPKNLNEQLMAFLNCNNQGGFEEDAPEVERGDESLPHYKYLEDTRSVIEILLAVADYEAIAIGFLKTWGKRLKKASGRRTMSGKAAYKLGVERFAIPQGTAVNIVCKVLGYANLREVENALAKQVAEGKKPVVFNKLAPGAFKEKFFPDLSQPEA